MLAATVGTATAGTEMGMHAEALYQQVEYAENATCGGRWGMVGMRGITADTGCIPFSSFCCLFMR
jgi:hypothetical protein